MLKNYSWIFYISSFKYVEICRELIKNCFIRYINVSELVLVLLSLSTYLYIFPFNFNNWRNLTIEGIVTIHNIYATFSKWRIIKSILSALSFFENNNIIQLFHFRDFYIRVVFYHKSLIVTFKHRYFYK